MPTPKLQRLQIVQAGDPHSRPLKLPIDRDRSLQKQNPYCDTQLMVMGYVILAQSARHMYGVQCSNPCCRQLAGIKKNQHDVQSQRGARRSVSKDKYGIGLRRFSPSRCSTGVSPQPIRRRDLNESRMNSGRMVAYISLYNLGIAMASAAMICSWKSSRQVQTSHSLMSIRDKGVGRV